MHDRVYNFSAGPAVLPEPVLAEAQRDLMALPGVGASILEVSHRSAEFQEILDSAQRSERPPAQPDSFATPEGQGLLFAKRDGFVGDR